MRFRKRPLLGTVRKRFAWLPRRLIEIRQQWVATGDAKVPFTPGWTYSTILAAPMPGTLRRAKTPPPSTSDMVTPVIAKNVNHEDCWIWLEPFLEYYVEDRNNNNGTWRPQWRHFSMPQQWNLFHEYD
jgi:hypothetical protein